MNDNIPKHDHRKLAVESVILYSAPPTSEVLLGAEQVKVRTIVPKHARPDYKEHLHIKGILANVYPLITDSTRVAAVRSYKTESCVSESDEDLRLTSRIFIFDSEKHLEEAWQKYDAEIAPDEDVQETSFSVWEGNGKTYPETVIDQTIHIPDNGNKALISVDGVSVVVYIDHLLHVVDLYKSRKSLK